MGFPKEVNVEPRIEIYRFTMYDIASDKVIESRRWGTKGKVAEIGGAIIEESKVLVNASMTHSDINGLTAIDYMPSTSN